MVKIEGMNGMLQYVDGCEHNLCDVLKRAARQWAIILIDWECKPLFFFLKIQVLSSKSSDLDHKIYFPYCEPKCFM